MQGQEQGLVAKQIWLNLEEENQGNNKVDICRCSKSKSGENIKHSLENSNILQSQGLVVLVLIEASLSNLLNL
ncbi:hypothetical protein V6N11_023726 [Hibiscus sabdariffa]|uniref:Uncharacterized protein n=1 Tax=Hibiscus sabdariffa TaxID=183260 RepID=A0ABR2TN39_9ROSI